MKTDRVDVLTLFWSSVSMSCVVAFFSSSISACVSAWLALCARSSCCSCSRIISCSLRSSAVHTEHTDQYSDSQHVLALAYTAFWVFTQITVITLKGLIHDLSDSVNCCVRYLTVYVYHSLQILIYHLLIDVHLYKFFTCLDINKIFKPNYRH